MEVIMKRNSFLKAFFAIFMAIFAQNQIQAEFTFFPDKPVDQSFGDYLDRAFVEPVLQKLDLSVTVSPLSAHRFVGKHPYFAIAGVYGLYRVYTYFTHSLPEQKAELIQSLYFGTLAKSKELARNLGGIKLEKIVENAIL